MNRTQYEKLHGSQVKQPCALCKARAERDRKVRRKRIDRQTDAMIAKAIGIKDGKVVELFDRDEFTGWHYRIGPNDSRHYTGCPK